MQFVPQLKKYTRKDYIVLGFSLMELKASKVSRDQIELLLTQTMKHKLHYF